MNNKFSFCAAILLATLAPIALHAQTATVLGAGTRVRLVTPALDANQSTGKVVSVTADTLEFRADAYPVTRTIPLSQVTSIEVSEGQVNNRHRFGLVGLLAGGVVGFATGYHPSGGHGGQVIGGGKKSASENAFLSAAIVGALGGVAGWIWGGSHPSEKWVALPEAGR